jgi:hypothetical protein
VFSSSPIDFAKRSSLFESQQGTNTPTTAAATATMNHDDDDDDGGSTPAKPPCSRTAPGPFENHAR